MPKTDLLTLAEIAELIAVKPTTTALYHHRSNRKRREGAPAAAGDFPAPDKHIGRIPVWKRGTIEKWIEARPSTTWNRDADPAE